MMPEPSTPESEPVPAADKLSSANLPAETPAAKAAAAVGSMSSDGMDMAKNVLNDHKGKLAIGVAATLGLMVFYKWREKNLAKEDPEEYARLQRFKSVINNDLGKPWDEDE